MKLEDLLNETDHSIKKELNKIKFESTGVYTREPTSEGIRYNAPTGTSDAAANALVYQIGSIGVEPIYSKSGYVLPDYLINDPQVVGYPDLEMQNEIYDWVLYDLPFGGYSIKDFGAGRGDFFGNIINKPSQVSPRPVYFGYEIKESLILAGKNKYKDINLIQEDFLKSEQITDYTICIGTLNEDHGFDKWDYFNKTLKHGIYTTKKAVIFVLSRNMDGNTGFLDYPFTELFNNIPSDMRFSIDYSKMEDIYKLTVHIGGYDF